MAASTWAGKLYRKSLHTSGKNISINHELLKLLLMKEKLVVLSSPAAPSRTIYITSLRADTPAYEKLAKETRRH